MQVLAKREFDAVVLGSGIAGLSVAIALARRKKRVLLIGQKAAAGESAPAAAGILDPFLELEPGHPLLKLSREAFLRYPAWLRQLAKLTQKEPGYAKTGMLYVAFSRAEEVELKKWFKWQQRGAIPVIWKTRTQILRNEPFINSRVRGGLFYPTIGRVRPRILLKALYRYAKILGVQILKSSRPPRLQVLGNSVRGVQLGSYVYASPAVINATGAWAGRNKLGPKPPIVPAKGQILLVKGKAITNTILHSVKGFYIVPWERNTFLLGSTVEFVGFRAGTTREGIRKIRRGTETLIPALKGLELADQWAGLRPYSKGGLPFIGPASVGGLYWALGFYRSGILISPYAGELMAEGILSGKWPAILKPFSPNRLREKKI